MENRYAPVAHAARTATVMPTVSPTVMLVNRGQIRMVEEKSHE